MVLVEGYTDVLAVHQAGLANCVGIMGTSFTEDQLTELERVVGAGGVLELCLDSDKAGQEAMLRAAAMAAGRSLQLRVVAMPEGADPADLAQQEGADALRERLAHSVPFVVFQVERILEEADTRSAEGRDRALAELAPALKLPVTAGALRDELLQRISNTLGLSEGRLKALLEAAQSAERAPRQSVAAPIRVTDPTVRAERAFLVLCIALPPAGRAALQSIDPAEHLTSERLRRAARHLAGQTEMPLSGLDAEDEELAQTMADLVTQAGKLGEVTVEQLEQQRLLLERARLERAIRRAREQRMPGIGELAREREHVMGEIRALDAQIDRAV
jgi:DNA primase